MQIVDFRAMGSSARAVVDCDTEQARLELEALPGRLHTAEHELSRFLPESALCRLNREGSARVDGELFDAIGVALQAAEATDGLITPTILAALEVAGYDRSFAAVEAEEDSPLDPAEACADAFRGIERDPTTRTIRLPPGTRLDLGGTAKGWCADRMARSLAHLGPALVDLGGDIATMGSPEGGWPVAVAHPTRPDAIVDLVCLRSGGIATSGRDHRRWRRGGVEQHHLIDPRTGRPAETDVVSATVLAPSALDAEVAAKVALLSGSEEGLARLERAQLAGLLVLDDGRTLRTSSWTDHLFGLR